MKEYIAREEVQKIIDYIRDKYYRYYNRSCKVTQFWWDTVRYFEKRTRALPAANVMEVVRCKDCKHWDTCYRFCKIHGLDGYGNSHFGEQGFCSFGERVNA